MISDCATRGKRPPALLDIDIVSGPTHLPQLDEVQLLYTLVKITPVSTRPLDRTPLNLSLVLDRSTSMKLDRLDAVRQATLSLVSQLEPEDLFSLVVFSDRAEVLIPAQHKPDMRTLRSVMSTIRASGGTEIHRGLVAGLAEVNRVRSDRQINHVILLTDGHTYGDTEKCLAAARAAAPQNIGISGIGVGSDWNEDFLDHLASAGGGAVLYIEQSDNIGAAFERRLRDLKDAWIPDLRVNIQYDPIANHKELFCISPELKRLDSTDSEFSLGPLQRTDSRVLLLENIVSSHLGGMHRIMRMEFRGNVPAFGAMAIQQQAVRVEFRPASQTRTLVPPAIVEAARRVSLLRMQERAELDVGQGMVSAGAGRLKQLASRLLQEGQSDLAEMFELEAEQLVASGVLSAAGTKRIRYGTRALPLPEIGVN